MLVLNRAAVLFYGRLHRVVSNLLDLQMSDLRRQSQ